MIEPWALVSAILATALVLHYIHAAGRERMWAQRISSSDDEWERRISDSDAEWAERIARSNAALQDAISFDRRRADEPAHPEQGKML